MGLATARDRLTGQWRARREQKAEERLREEAKEFEEQTFADQKETLRLERKLGMEERRARSRATLEEQRARLNKARAERRASSLPGRALRAVSKVPAALASRVPVAPPPSGGGQRREPNLISRVLYDGAGPAMESGPARDPMEIALGPPPPPRKNGAKPRKEDYGFDVRDIL